MKRSGCVYRTRPNLWHVHNSRNKYGDTCTVHVLIVCTFVNRKIKYVDTYRIFCICNIDMCMLYMSQSHQLKENGRPVANARAVPRRTCTLYTSNFPGHLTQAVEYLPPLLPISRLAFGIFKASLAQELLPLVLAGLCNLLKIFTLFYGFRFPSFEGPLRQPSRERKGSPGIAKRNNNLFSSLKATSSKSKYNSLFSSPLSLLNRILRISSTL